MADTIENQGAQNTELNDQQQGLDQKPKIDILSGESLFISKTIFKKLSKKYNKKFGNEATEDELIELIRQDLLTKRQNSLLLREYFRAKFWRELGLLILSSFSITIAFDYFISSTGPSGIFPAGVGAVARFLAVSFTKNPGSFLFVFQFALNIPLIIFGWIKLGWQFTVRTVFYMIMQIAFDQILTYIPVINPTSFHVIVDVQFIGSLNYSWNYAIWLFVFATIGGALMGWSYSLVYRVGGSTGGTDFITIYISKRKSRPVGTINRDVNFMILSVIIILNTIMLPLGDLNHDIILGQISHIDWNSKITSDQTFYGYVSQIINGTGAPAAVVPPVDFAKSDWLELLIKLNHSQLTDMANKLSLKYEALIKFQFLFGPSLFGSLTLIVISGLATNYFYPKYKLRTYMISTNKPKDIHQKIIELGFQNEIASWDTTSRSRGNYLHRTMFMLSMPVMQWREIQSDLFMVDPYLKVTIMRTKAVVGLFKYEPVENANRSELLEKVAIDQTEIDKIKQIAIVKFKKEINKSDNMRRKLSSEIKAGGEKKRSAEREINRIKKNRDEMLVKFKQNIKDIEKMDTGVGATIIDTKVDDDKKGE